MRYRSFRIQNFKGIKDTTIDLGDGQGVSVYALVGLNESGKTTILEAIHSFSPDSATSQLVGGDATSGVPFKRRVPRHLLSNFTGNVVVTAAVSVTEEDRTEVAKSLAAGHKITLNTKRIPDMMAFERRQEFQNGNLFKSYFYVDCPLEIKTGSQRKWREPTMDEYIIVRDALYQRTPDIAYFPTFVFEFPKRIFLTDSRGTVIDQFYRQVFQDILDFDGQGHSIDGTIISRIRSSTLVTQWVKFLTLFNSGDDKEKIQHVMDRAGSVVTRVVFGRWNQIFGEDARGKEVFISYDVLEGEVVQTNGSTARTEEHDIAIKFQIRDGTRRFDVNDRSLGFRWFFAFMLFTQFRVARKNARPLLFLFDEPASNLHAAAQQKLIESFPAIVKGYHTLIYSTHSHYMIEPKWLEQTFIVTNRSDSPSNSVLAAVSLDDESIDIRAFRYRTFVNDNPSQTSYFQPILDRLEVVPSKFDQTKSSVIVEGKSDYYVLRYAQKLLRKENPSLLPGVGAGTFGALVAINVGWNLNMLFLLDADKQGKEERNRYCKDFCLPQERALTVDEIVEGVSVIEDLLDEEGMSLIQAAITSKAHPNKGQIRRFFQERLASDDIIPLGKAFSEKVKTMLDNLEHRLKPSN